MTVFVFENLEKSHRRKLFTLAGVDYFITSYSWLNLPLIAFVGIIIALIFAPVNQVLSQILVGIGYGLLIVISSFCHSLGHIISSRLVNTPMKSVLMTATVNITRYEDEEEQPSLVHIGRALGGPVFNLLLGLIAIAIYNFAMPNHFLLFFGMSNLVFAAFSSLPIPSVDGGVIWRELRDWKR